MATGCVVHAGQAAYGCPDCDRLRGVKAAPVVPSDLRKGVAEFIGYAAMRGISLPIDFCKWLSSSPMHLNCEQCIALYVCLRSVTEPAKGDG